MKHFFRISSNYEVSDSELKIEHREEIILRYYMGGDVISRFKFLTTLMCHPSRKGRSS